MFFFFQAEDGIRDDLVTGVQTCALPISHLSCPVLPRPDLGRMHCPCHEGWFEIRNGEPVAGPPRDRKSTRLNSSHQIISYAVFCLKKKKITDANSHAHCSNALCADRATH